MMAWLAELAIAVGLSSDLAIRLFGTMTVLALWVLAQRLARRIVQRTVEDPASRFQIARIAGYLVGGAGVSAIARIWFESFSGLATYFGLLSAGVAIALQDPLTNLAGWLFILIRRPFRIGDRIQLGTHAGDVVDIRPFRFVMLEIGNWVHADQSTGRVLHMPNGLVFKNAIANYDEAFGYIWHELELTLTFESNWRKAKSVLAAVMAEHVEKLAPDAHERIAKAADTLHIQFSKLTPVVWTSLTDSGVRLTMRYLCRPRERRSSESAVWEAVLAAFEALPDVDFAYPTTRKFDNLAEGKARARPRES